MGAGYNVDYESLVDVAGGQAVRGDLGGFDHFAGRGSRLRGPAPGRVVTGRMQSREVGSRGRWAAPVERSGHRRALRAIH